MKIRAACGELGIEPRMAQVLVHVHGLTRGGEQPDKLILKSGETAEQRMGSWARFLASNYAISQELNDAKRLYEDHAYRETMLGLYQKVLPRAKTMSFREMLHVLTSTNLSRY